MAQIMKLYNKYLGPATDLLLDLGTPGIRWNNIYAGGDASFGKLTLSDDLDMTDHHIHSIDKLYGVTDSIVIDMGQSGRILLTAPGAGTPFSTPDFSFEGSAYINDDFGFGTTKGVQFRDANTTIASADENHLDLTAVTSIDVNANLDISGKNIVTDTATGTMFGSTSAQKIAFLGATPVVRQASSADIKDVIVTFGLMIDSGASPLNLDGGSFITTGTATIGRLDISDSTNFVFYDDELVADEDELVFA